MNTTAYNPTLARRRRGVTMAEMLVAVSITVGMMLAVGTVFKSASDAAGRAMALNDLMLQLRSFTNQLRTDVSNIDPHLPLIVVFEQHTEADGPLTEWGDESNPDRPIHYDRLFFFTRGNFAVPDYNSTTTLHASTASVLYAQSADTGLRNPNLDYPDLPPRRIMARVSKALVFDTSAEWYNNYPSDYPLDSGPEYFDVMPVFRYETSSIYASPRFARQYWLPQRLKDVKQAIIDAGGSPPTDDLNLNIPYPYNTTTNLILGLDPDKLEWYHDYLNGRSYDVGERHDAESSLIRRPNLEAVSDAEVDSRLAGALQRLYMLPDITDFQIQLWFKGSKQWFPNLDTLTDIKDASLLPPEMPADQYQLPYDQYKDGDSSGDIAYAFYWNAAHDFDDPATDDRYAQIDADSSNYGSSNVTIDFRCEERIKEMVSLTNSFWGGTPIPWDTADLWPRGIKISFRLHDRDRRHFPEGLPYSCIITLPPRD